MSTPAELLRPGLCSFVHSAFDNTVLVGVEDAGQGVTRVHLSLNHGKGPYRIVEIPFEWWRDDQYGRMYLEIINTVKEVV